jgi:hypothetical protein
MFGHEFVREILDIALQPSSTPASTLYPPKIVRYLLENHVVSAGMLSQSLLELFVENKDWVRRAYPCTYADNTKPPTLVHAACSHVDP